MSNLLLVGLLSAAALAADVRAAVLPPPPELTVSQWADRERVLGSEETSEPGRWRTDRVPYLRAIMDAVSNPEVRTVVFKGSARVAKTEFENNVIGYHIHQDPSPMLLVYPSEQKAQDYSKEKLTPMLKNTPALRGRVAEAKSRDSGNTQLHKIFQGGFLAMAGSNTPNGLDSRTCRLVLFDELDKCAKAAKNLGDPIALAKNRTITYPGRWKHVLVSTPSEEGDSPITREYEKTNMQLLYLPCPHCGEFETLQFRQIKWEEGNPEGAVYVCPHCGAVIADSEKPAMLQAGEWRAMRPEITVAQGFALWAAYSPWVTWSQIASTFVERRNDGPEALKTFVNEWLGENWNPNQGTEAKVEGLQKRARDSFYASRTVPDQVGLLFGAADTQDDRLEFLVRGLGRDRQKFTVYHERIHGNPATQEPWDRLEALILQHWFREDGQPMRIRKFCVDNGGHFPKEAMAFCKRPALRGIVVPTRGATRPQRALAVPAKNRTGLWMLDVGAIKDTVMAELRIDNNAMPGYQWFPSDIQTLTPDYFQQLMSEKKEKGAWKKLTPSTLNEVLDCHVYTDAAVAIYNPRKGEVEAALEFYREGAGLPQAEALVEPAPEPAPPPPPEPPRQKPRPGGQKRVLGKWGR